MYQRAQTHTEAPYGRLSLRDRLLSAAVDLPRCALRSVHRYKQLRFSIAILR